ncbi:MAG: substrate-binding domain-containing protein [Victivallales bacterium]
MQERIPLNKRIYLKIREEIYRKRFSPGSLLPSEKKLAENFSVSRKTIRHALNLLESEKIAFPVNGLGWKISGIQQARDVKPVAIINYYRDFNNDFAQSAYALLKSNGARVHFYYAIRDDADLDEILTPENYSGIIYVSCNPVPKYHIESAKKHQLPIVCACLNSAQAYDTISTDNVAAMNMLINHLIFTGHKNIFFVGTKIMDPAFSIRHRTYFNSIKRHSLNPHSIILDDNFLSQHFAIKLLDECKSKKQRMDAIIAVTSTIAKDILMLFHENKIRVPEDISLTCIGHTIDPRELSHYGLNTITGIVHSWKEIGRRAAERILSRIKGDTSPAGVEFVKPLFSEADSILDRTARARTTR